MAGVAETIDEMHATLVQVADLVDGLVDGECAGVLRSLQRVVSSVQELQRRVLDRAVLRGEWSVDGFRSPVRWAAVCADVPERTARRLRQQAAALRELPAASVAALQGALHDVFVEEIARCQRSAPDRFDGAIDEVFTAVACTGDLAAFAMVVREWKARVDAEAASDPAAPVQPDRGSFHLSESIDGRWFGDLELSPQDGRFVASAIDRGVGRMLQAKRDGDPAFEELNVAAMRARALVDLVDRALRLNPRRAAAPDRYHVAFTLDVETYVQAVGALTQGQGEQRPCTPPRPPGANTWSLWRSPMPMPMTMPAMVMSPMTMPPMAMPPPTSPAAGGPMRWPPPDLRRSTRGDDGPRAETRDRASRRSSCSSSGTAPAVGWPSDLRSSQSRQPLPVEALCDCSIYRLVLGAESEVLDVGRAQRSWPAAMRNAIARRDGGCRYPRCTEPVAHCDVHHCTHWEHGGHTAVTNGVALCRSHHTFIHANRWTVTLDQHQHPVFTRADGTIYTGSVTPR